ncbi:MAG: site-specific integrase [Clostridia bacterium]|nr:site-specific integrase [Clostridia bacterium]
MVRGHIEQRYKTTFTIILDLGRDASGKRKRIAKSFKGSKREAEAEMLRMIAEYEKGQYIKPSRITTAEFLDRWLSTARHAVSPKTAERYADYIKAAVSALGSIRLQELNPIHLEEFYDQLRNSGLSARTILHHHRVLHTALNAAVNYRLLAENPADRAQPPKPEPPEMQILTQEQLAELIWDARNSKYFPLLYLAAYTGMRRGELLALRWQDIDWQTATISIRQTLQQTKDGLFFKEAKNRSSRRRIAISDSTISVLRKHRKDQARERLKHASSYNDQGLVFCQPNGDPLKPDTVSTWFYKFQRSRKKEPCVRFHDLRHTHASLLLLAGWNPKVVQERLGHSSISTTMDIYSHILPSLHQSAAASLDAIIKPMSPDPESDRKK